MYKWFSSAGYRQNRHRQGVTLVEILIVTVVIALLAAVSFPVYKIVQQREKEKRLKKILNSFRAALLGSKSALSAREFVEGYRSYVVAYGSSLIDNIVAMPLVEEKEEIKSSFLRMSNREGFGLPSTPQKLLADNYTLVINVPTGKSAPDDFFTMNIPIERRFIRHIPPHPFLGWVPDARFEFKAAVNTTALETFPFTSPDWGVNASGVSDIVSRGAGLALNGSRTDDW